MEASEAERAEFAAALSAQLQGVDRAELAAKVGVSEAAISLWATGKNEPKRANVFALEDFLDLTPGTLSRCLGYLPASAVPALTVEDAVRSDKDLPRDVRTLLLAAIASQRRS